MDIMEMGASDELVSKWGPALDGINSDYTKRVTAQLLENQLKATEHLNEDAVGIGTTTVGQLGTFQKFAFPLVRRVFPELIANNLVSVQPMSGPVSQVFYLGSARTSAADGRQSLYSKYQLTYRGGRTGEFTDASGIDLDTVTIPNDTSTMANHAMSGALGGKAALDGNAAGNHEKRSQQDDKGDVIQHINVQDGMQTLMKAEGKGKGHNEKNSPERGNLAKVVMPEMWSEQREKRNGE